MPPSENAAPALPEALPGGAVLAHVGIHKTGTTALQSVLAAQRPVLDSLGVTYPDPSDSPDHHKSSLALSNTKWGRSPQEGRGVNPDHWPVLVSMVKAATGRSVVSSEFFGDLRGSAGRRFVQDLGKDRLHVVIGMRPLSLVLASAWQQRLKLGESYPFEQWLRDVYMGARRTKNPRDFWSRYAYGEAVRRWTSRVGVENVSVLVLDDVDHSWQPRVFEALLALPAGTLTDVPASIVNRSLTGAEAEGLRRANELMKGRIGWEVYEPMIRIGAVLSMIERRAPGPEEPRIAVPAWAVEQAVADGQDSVREIAKSGVRVIGDLDSLGRVPARLAAVLGVGQDATAQPRLLPVEAFAQALSGSVDGARLRGVDAAGSEGPVTELKVVNQVPAGDLLQVIRVRVAKRVRRRLGLRRRRSAP
jgi:hypothetical protein